MTLAFLHWDHPSLPCFCDPIVEFRLDRIRATPETLAALFGLVMGSDSLATSIRVHSLTHEKVAGIVPLQVNKEYDTTGGPSLCWPLVENKHYQVTIFGFNAAFPKVVPIRDIFVRLPGSGEEEKSDRLLALSNHFYELIWNNDPDVPPDFRNKFYTPTSNARIQAFRQFDWLYEAFGGPTMAGEPSRAAHLVSKVRAKHTTSRMTLSHACTWLHLMERALVATLSDGDPVVLRSLRYYWLHFYSLYPFSDDDRRELRQVAIGDT